MKVSASFSGKEIESVSLDFSKLREEGLKYIQELSGDIWTDYNSHDPGVTILEQVIYALTDVAFRTSLPIEDLLTTKKDVLFDTRKNGFFAPSKILSSHPVTIKDARKMIADKFFEEIQNVWIMPTENIGFEEKLNGINQLEILPKINFLKSSAESKNDFLNRVNYFLKGNRNIGECYKDAILLEPLPISINFDIYLTDKVDFHATIAKAFLKLLEFFYSPIHYSSLGEMQKSGISLQETFSGPRLNNGFIKDFINEHRLKIISTDEIQKLLSKVEGVVKCSVNSFLINGEIKTFIETGQGKFFHLLKDVDLDNFADNRFDGIYKTMTVFVNNKELKDFNKHKINNLLTENWSKKHRGYPIGDSSDKQYLKSFAGNWQKPEVYHSIQRHFPKIYGIGEEGLSKHEPEERKARAHQLKAFLLLFEQHFANHLAQLGNLNEFFNIGFNEQFKKTYFAQWMDSVPGINELATKDIRKIESYLESKDISFNRKNRIFNHLLSRFGEGISEIPWKISRHVHLIRNKKEYNRTVLRHKSQFLERLENLSYNRTRGEQLIPDETSTNNIKFKRIPSGLEEIIVAKTGIMQTVKNSLIHEVKFNGFENIDEKTLYRESLKAENYRIKKSDFKTNKTKVEFQKEKDNWIKIMENEGLPVQDISKLVDSFIQLNLDSEGIYIVDHILLQDFLNGSKYGFCYFDENCQSLLHTIEKKSWIETEEERDEIFRPVKLKKENFSIEKGTWIIKYENWKPISFNIENKEFDSLKSSIEKDTYIYSNGKLEKKSDGSAEISRKETAIEKTIMENLNEIFDEIFSKMRDLNSPIKMALFRNFYGFENGFWSLKYGDHNLASFKIPNHDLAQINDILQKQAFFFNDGKWRIKYDETMADTYKINTQDLKTIISILNEQNYFFEEEMCKIKHNPKMLDCFRIEKTDLQILSTILENKTCVFNEGKWKLKSGNNFTDIFEINKIDFLKIIDILKKQNFFFDDEHWSIKYNTNVFSVPVEKSDLLAIIDILNHQSHFFTNGKWTLKVKVTTSDFRELEKEELKNFYSILNKRRTFFFEENAQKFILDFVKNIKILTHHFETFYQKNKSIIKLLNHPENSGRIRFNEVEEIRLRGTQNPEYKKYTQRRLIFQRKLSDDLDISDDAKIINEDFFNLKVSVIMPDWPVRFQEEQFKDYVKNLIHERIPSHINNEIYWVDFNQIKSFELKYNIWQNLKAESIDSKNPSKELMKAAFDVHSEIQKLNKII